MTEANNYRSLAKVPKDIEMQSKMNAKRAKDIADRSRITINQADEFSDEEVKSYWETNMDPEIAREAKEGEYSVRMLHLHPSSGEALSKYGKKLGYKVKVSAHDNTYGVIVIRWGWGPRFTFKEKIEILIVVTIITACIVAAIARIAIGIGIV